jgi:hypothetical protein
LLFRTYPEPFQSILNIGGGKSKLVATNLRRPTSAQFCDDLTASLRIPGVSNSELSSKSSEVWWEKVEAKSDKWLS